MKSSKVLSRRFKLQIACHHPAAPIWVEQVINEIENDTLCVFDPTDESALDEVTNENGEILLLAKAKFPVSIKEWLPVGCQCIRWAHEYDYTEEDKKYEKIFGWYYNNAYQVLWPADCEYDPQGPSVFLGEIVLAEAVKQRLWGDCSGQTENWFKFIIAHELVHVFDAMRFIVPAVMNWRKFYRDVLHDGSRNDILFSKLKFTSCFVDSYGQENERAMVEQYWPSQVDKWFKANRGTSDSK